MRYIYFTVLLAIVVLLFVSTGLAEQGTDVVSNAENIWNGTWACSNHFFFIEQNSSGITGSYMPKRPEIYDTGRLEGSLSEDGKTYSGKWIESGSITANLSSDNMSYTRIVTTNPQGNMTEPYTHLDNATRIGAISDPDNLWTGSWLNVRKTYNYTQNGSVVRGTNIPFPGVPDQPGMMEGTVSEDGKIITGNWTETGYYNFTMSDDGSFFNGTFSETLDPTANLSFMIIKRII